MQIYKDESGREFPIEITGYEMRELRRAGIELGSPEKLDGVFRDHGILGDVMIVLCKSDFEKHGIDERAFLKAMKGDAVDSAALAFMRAYCDFFPKEKGEPMKRAFEKLVNEQREITRKALEEINADSGALSGSDSSNSPQLPE